MGKLIDDHPQRVLFFQEEPAVFGRLLDQRRVQFLQPLSEAVGHVRHLGQMPEQLLDQRLALHGLLLQQFGQLGSIDRQRRDPRCRGRRRDLGDGRNLADRHPRSCGGVGRIGPRDRGAGGHCLAGRRPAGDKSGARCGSAEPVQCRLEVRIQIAEPGTEHLDRLFEQYAAARPTEIEFIGDILQCPGEMLGHERQHHVSRRWRAAQLCQARPKRGDLRLEQALQDSRGARCLEPAFEVVRFDQRQLPGGCRCFVRFRGRPERPVQHPLLQQVAVAHSVQRMHVAVELLQLAVRRSGIGRLDQPFRSLRQQFAQDAGQCPLRHMPQFGEAAHLAPRLGCGALLVATRQPVMPPQYRDQCIRRLLERQPQVLPVDPCNPATQCRGLDAPPGEQIDRQLERVADCQPGHGPRCRRLLQQQTASAIVADHAGLPAGPTHGEPSRQFDRVTRVAAAFCGIRHSAPFGVWIP